MNPHVEEHRTHYIKHLSDPLSFYVKPFRIFGNLYYAGTRDSSTILVDTGEGLILFDTGFSNMQAFLIESIHELGYELTDIRMIFHTHGHFDHYGATAFLKKVSNAKALISRIDGENFIKRPELSLCDYFEAPTTPFTPDVLLEDGDKIVLGATTVTCHAMPGHTEGCMTYTFPVFDGKESYTAVLCGGVGTNTMEKNFIDEYLLDLRLELLQSLKKMLNIRADIYLGNHAGQSQTMEKMEKLLNGDPHAFIDENAWPAFIEGRIRQMEERFKKEGLIE